jgi:S1-C subfamily serine protease
MAAANALAFAAAARALAVEARALGLAVPGFRSPPRLAGACRSLGRHPGGGAVVSVVVRGRPLAEVAADMVDGVLALNRVPGADADALRRALLAAAIGEEAVRAA